MDFQVCICDFLSLRYEAKTAMWSNNNNFKAVKHLSHGRTFSMEYKKANCNNPCFVLTCTAICVPFSVASSATCWYDDEFPSVMMSSDVTMATCRTNEWMTWALITMQYRPSHNTHRLQLFAICNHGDLLPSAALVGRDGDGGSVLSYHGDGRAEDLQVWADDVVRFHGNFGITFVLLSALRRRLKNLCVYIQNHSLQTVQKNAAKIWSEIMRTVDRKSFSPSSAVSKSPCVVRLCMASVDVCL